MGKKTLGFILCSLSVIWALIILVRVKSFLGMKFFLVTGRNLLDGRGFEVSDLGYIIMWLVAIAAFAGGVNLFRQSQKRSQREEK